MLHDFVLKTDHLALNKRNTAHLICLKICLIIETAQPWPCSTLMICIIALYLRTYIIRVISHALRRQRTKTTWSKQLLGHCVENLFTLFRIERRIIECHFFFAIAMYVLMNKTTLGYQLKACGSNRHAARYAGINDKRNIVLSMAMAGSLSAAGASLYWLSGNTEFFWSTYQALPAIGFNGIPVALLAVNNPIGVIFSGMFMAMLDIVGQNLTGYTAYNEYITDVIISVIVYLSAFSLMIQTMLPKVKKANAANANAEPAPNKEAEKEEGGESV